jgi:high affinity Mn2+ porin
MGTLPALAADRGDMSPAAWTGYYFGSQLGYSWGGADWHLSGPTGTQAGAFEFFRAFDAFTGTGSYFAGLQGGYNRLLPSGVVIGWEADLLAPNTITDQRTFTTPGTAANIAETVLMSGSVRGRLGFVHDSALFYATAGYAWSYDSIVRTQLLGTSPGGSAPQGITEKEGAWRNGVAVGAGVEVPVAAKWTAGLEYLFATFGDKTVAFPAAEQRFASDLNTQSLRLSLNYQFAEDRTDAARGPSALASDRWSVHGQTTFVQQYAFPFNAPYHGPNSLDPNAGRATWDATLFVGWKLWPGAELWVNPEIDQGFGLSDTLGVAGFPSGEAYKLGANFPYARVPRAFMRETINLGGESEAVEASANRFAGSETQNRLVLTVGKLAVTDIFDNNKYAHDPRADFLNWALIDTGTFDYAADAWGYTYGAAVEWYQGPWTLRAGLFDLSEVPNSTDLDPTFAQHQWVGEVERRYDVAGQPGKIAVTAFLTQGRMASFSDAIRLAALTGAPADASLVRRYQNRPGVSVNVEQQLSPTVGVFARAGIADGRFETFEFTDIDRTVAAGVVLQGKLWGRSDDTLGVAGIINGISREHEQYLNAGGLGITVGDGMLPHPGNEQILEAYYSFPIRTWRATFTYEFVTNPAYNEDRGPVSIISTRLHAQF